MYCENANILNTFLNENFTSPSEQAGPSDNFSAACGILKFLFSPSTRIL